MDLTPCRNSADTLLLGSLVLDGVMLICTYGLTRLSVGRALRPVRAMTEQATQRSAVAAVDRFGVEKRPAELAALGSSLDALLDRIRAVLRHEQHLTGELSHELRTPLSRIIMELDWWRGRPRSTEETRASHQVIAEATQSTLTICDTLLNDARENARSPSMVPGTTGVVPVLRRLAQQLEAPHPVKATVEAVCPQLEAGVTPALLERIVSPLLANADRFWLTRDHLPEFATVLAEFPSLAGMADAIGARAEPVPIPWDCADGLFEAYWRRPGAYLEDHVRRAMSVWTRVGPEAEHRAVRSLSDDLNSGRWAERNSGLADLDAADLGLRLLIG
ncbi:histidine kinase dimerization/phospho-acceptor domain-containing protein [Streptomyces sp. DASNCL29]|uniref:histidine kinase dimerization/phospho-acceptor domain-containing protein n=1 Tax=Streptomyces sp. DASNCL29 TaxID=2583819 RepID=UPI001F0E05F7|nr:histidine kinase dimerization/phospho-acceptor domain-containing protein [Streptomyces sp. DASNCL29]